MKTFEDQLNSNSQHPETEAGFIIFTIPVILILFAFFLASITNDTKPNNFYFETATQSKLESVRIALAAYTHRNYHVPCPGNPASPRTGAAPVLGQEDRVAATGNCSSNMGILPFRELGLTEDHAKDEWGNFITYKVSPDFARTVNVASFQESGDVNNPIMIAKTDSGESYLHEICRTEGWMDNETGYTLADGSTHTFSSSQNVNHNIYKASFCCPSNVTGASTASFKAADQQPDVGSTTSNLRDENGIAKDEIIMGIEPLDLDQALYDESKQYYSGAYSDGSIRTTTAGERIAANNRWSAGATLDYNDGFDEHTNPDGTKYDLGEGFGPLRNISGTSTRSDDHSGKYYWQAAAFDIQTSDTLKVREMTLAMSDIGTNNWQKPVQISMDVVVLEDADSNPATPKTEKIIENVSMVLITPIADGASPGSTQYGVGDFKISLDMFTGNGTEDGLFHPGVDSNYTGSLHVHPAALPSSTAVTFFNDNKAKLMTALAANGLTLNDVSIGKLKLNPTHTSMGFSVISYGSGASPVDTDLRGENEAGDRILAERGSISGGNSYQPADQPHNNTTSVAQDFEAPAYVLISHGANGEGAYIEGGGQVDHILPANENASEFVNFSDPIRYRTLRKIAGSTTQDTFDDIVLWDSQITLYNSLRNGTCESSQAL